MKHNKKSLSESLYENDLQWLVSDTIMMDMHKTKLGSDSEYLVVAIPVNDKKPATDLAQFLESSVYDFLDIEVSPGMDGIGRYLVYVELERNPELFDTIKGILEDVSRLSGIKDWKFKTMNMREDVDFDEENFVSRIIVTPEEYLRIHPEVNDEEQDAEETQESFSESIKQRMKFLVNY